MQEDDKQKSILHEESPPLTADQRSLDQSDRNRSYEVINDQNEGMEVIAGISHAGIIAKLAKNSTGSIES